MTYATRSIWIGLCVVGGLTTGVWVGLQFNVMGAIILGALGLALGAGLGFARPRHIAEGLMSLLQ